jgi:hypothetical protein
VGGGWWCFNITPLPLSAGGNSTRTKLVSEAATCNNSFIDT